VGSAAAPLPEHQGACLSKAAWRILAFAEIDFQVLKIPERHRPFVQVCEWAASAVNPVVAPTLKTKGHFGCPGATLQIFCCARRSKLLKQTEFGVV
jgi:hypothetical protein